MIATWRHIGFTELAHKMRTSLGIIMTVTNMTAISSILRNYLPMAQEGTLHEIAGRICEALEEVAPAPQQRLRVENAGHKAKQLNTPSAQSL
jgi:hypothetical protein